jgi:hypothetical protein
MEPVRGERFDNAKTFSHICEAAHVINAEHHTRC